MNVLILGGTGYLGGKIIERLINENHNVICLRRENSNVNRLNLSNSNLKFWYIKELKEKMNQDVKIDCFINTACKYLKNNIDESDVIEANLYVPLKIFTECINYGVKRFLTIGTGLPKNFNLYSFTKQEFASFGKWYSERLKNTKNDIEFCNIELEYFYGADEPIDRFIPTTIRKLKSNQPILLTKGTQHRDFIYVDDVVNAIESLVDIQKLPPYMDLPLGSGESPTIRDVVEYLHKECKSNSELIFGAVPQRNNEPDCIADIIKLKEFGININYHWKDGMKKIINMD